MVRLFLASYRPKVLAAWGTMLLWLAANGCGTGSGPPQPEAFTDLREIVRAYDLALATHRRPPKDVEEIRKILADLHVASVVGDPELALASSRDGQPYVIIMGANLGAEITDEILAYEKTGLDGKRYVLRMSREIAEIADAEFAQSSFARGHRPEGK